MHFRSSGWLLNSHSRSIQVPASRSLLWVPCFDAFKCANLITPLDYEDDSAGEFTMAWIVKTSNKPNAQDILYNPGGPGESGITNLQSLVLFYDRYLDSDNFNLVSFDPRGGGVSGP